MQKFFPDIYTEDEAEVIVFGVPVGKHAQSFLNSVRKESQFIESFYLPTKMDWSDKIKIVDAGDIQIKSLDDITRKTKDILDKGKVPVMLSGGHVASFFSIDAFSKDVKVIDFDAHLDCKDSYEDERLKEMSLVPGIKYDNRINSATWMRRTAEKRSPKNFFLIGARSGDASDLRFMEKNRIIFFDAMKVKKNFGELKGELEEFVKDSKLYVTVDIDCFDPAVAPAVYHPEPNGLNFQEFLELMEIIRKGNIVGFDIVELKPIAGSNVTEFLAVQVMFELLRSLKR